MLIARAFAWEPVVPTGPRRLTTAERARVAMEILASYGLARWWLLRLGYPAIVAAARNVKAAPPPVLSAREKTATALRLGQAVERTLQSLPFDSRCLVKALVLTRLLARRGIECSFVLGVRSQPDFAAHAWVERDGVALLMTMPAFHRLSES